MQRCERLSDARYEANWKVAERARARGRSSAVRVSCESGYENRQHRFDLLDHVFLEGTMNELQPFYDFRLCKRVTRILRLERSDR